MPFLFTNPMLLAALAGLGLPVLLHLLLKRKTQRLRFSTNRFFQKQDEQASSKRKLRNWLLLLLRLLVFALLVLVFARPYLPSLAGPNGTPPPRQVIVVLDPSASLQANDGAGPRWVLAKKAVRNLLSAMRPDDRAALVTCGTRAQVAVGFSAPAVVAQVLADLPAGTGTGELGAGLREATRLIALGDPTLTTSVTVVSDFQRTGAQNLGAAPLPPELDVKLIAIGDLAAPNVAVAELNLTTANDALPHATIANFGADDFRSLATEFLVDGQGVASQSVPLAAGGVSNLSLKLPALKPGWHSAEFRVRSKDALALDDARFAAFFTPEPVRVAFVEGRTTTRSFEEQNFFVAAALDPAFGTTNASRSPFALQRLRPEDLTRVLRLSPTNRPEVVLVPPQKSLPTSATEALQEFVQSGGGVLLWLGDELSVNRFNTEFAELTPALMRSVESAAGDDDWHMGEHDPAAAIFASFRTTAGGNLTLPGFHRRCALTPVATSLVHARFDDGVPLLIGRTVGRGRVLLANTSADTSWSDWPKRKTFVPWLHNTAQFLAARGTDNAIRHGDNWVAGAGEDLELGAAAGRQTFRLLGPAGMATNVIANERGGLDLALTIPGVYSLQEPNGQEVRRWAVNVPAAESDLAALRPTEFLPQLVRVAHPSGNLLGADWFGAGRNQREFWRALLVGALVLLVVETLFSNRSYA